MQLQDLLLFTFTHHNPYPAIPEVRHSGGPPRKDEMGNRRLGSLDYLKFWVQPTALERNRRFSIYFRL